MSVKLRKRKNKDKKRYYLDIYHDNQRWTESLDLYEIKARDPREREINRKNKSLAESIRAKKQLELESKKHGIGLGRQERIFFKEYFDYWLEHYPNKDIRLAEAAHAQFFKYIETTHGKKRITNDDITKKVVVGFKKYLDERYNGETPHNYFSKFIKLCREATEEGVFKANPCSGVKNTKAENMKKDVLFIEEIKALEKTRCANPVVRDAFYFCLNTGIRWITMKELKWSNFISDTQMRIQQKGERSYVVSLNENARKVLPPRGKRDQLVFANLPSHSYALRALSDWVQAAGIPKHITWHCSRHSFAVNLLLSGVNIKTVSQLLGHTSLKHTTKYLQITDKFNESAVKSIEY